MHSPQKTTDPPPRGDRSVLTSLIIEANWRSHKNNAHSGAGQTAHSFNQTRKHS